MEHIPLERLTGLIAFARAASLGSYTIAARSLGISPSAVSKSIQRLEARLGIRLFHRTTRSLTLTSEGQDLHARALRLLHEAEEIEQAAMASRAEPAGILRITSSLPIGTHILAPALPRSRERYPRLSIDMRLGDRIADLNDEGIDIAVRVGNLTDSRLISRRLGTHKLCTFAAPSYLKRNGMPHHPDELAQHQCVNFRYQSSGQLMQWSFKLGERTVERAPNAGVVLDVGDALVRVLVAGGGIGVCATYIAAKWLESGHLVPVLPEYAIDKFDITALWAESRRNNPNVKAFVAYLTELFSDTPPWEQAFRRAVDMQEV